MKDWFPLTNYDFYAYLTAGMVIVAAVDRAFLGSMLAGQTSWTVVNGAFWAAIAYLTGQIIAIPSSAIFEHVVARKLLHAPSQILLGFEVPRWREIAVRWIFGAREYDPLPVATQNSIKGKVASALAVHPTQLEGESAFTCAFPHARGVSDTATRLDNFLNQYGMCRNVSFASFVAFGLMTWRARSTGDRFDWTIAVAALILALGLFGRFVKFYAAYAREVFRTFDKCAPAASSASVVQLAPLPPTGIPVPPASP